MSKDRFFSGGGQSEIDALQTVTEVATGIDGVYAYKCGKVVTLVLHLSNSITAPQAGWHQIGILPVGIRPKTSTAITVIRFAVFDNSASTYANSQCLAGIVYQGGGLSFYAFSDHLTFTPNGTVTYLCE